MIVSTHILPCTWKALKKDSGKKQVIGPNSSASHKRASNTMVPSKFSLVSKKQEILLPSHSSFSHVCESWHKLDETPSHI